MGGEKEPTRIGEIDNKKSMKNPDIEEINMKNVEPNRETYSSSKMRGQEKAENGFKSVSEHLRGIPAR